MAACRCCSRRCWRCGTRCLRPLLVAAAAAAWTCWCAGERLAERLPLAALGADFELTGTVGGFPSAAPGQITFRVRRRGAAAARRAAARAPHVVRRRRPACGPATSLAVTARLRPPRGARNPGGFDYEQWLLVNGYGATGYVRSGAVRRGGARRARDARGCRFRGALAERIGAASADADGVALLTALALGERFRFTEQHWADFRRTGTSHLVAVSGMHVALLGIVVFVALRCVVAAAAGAARELRSRGRGRREPARDGLLRGADGLRRAGAALARHDRRRAGGAREPPPHRRRAARRGDARRRARLRSVRTAVGVVLVVVRRRRDPAGARGAAAAGTRGAGPSAARRARRARVRALAVVDRASRCCR